MELTGLSGVQRLAELGLSVEVIATALRRADSAAGACSDLDPPILQGLLRWARTTRYLREQLVSSGWSFDNPRNLARTIHPSGEFAVVIATGDERTGRPGGTAGPRHPRGYATEQAVAAAPPRVTWSSEPKSKANWLFTAWTERILLPPIALRPSETSTERTTVEVHRPQVLTDGTAIGSSVAAADGTAGAR